MRTFFFLAALALGVGSAACGAAPISSESRPTTEEVKAESEKLESSTTSAATAGCSNWLACHRVCLRKDPRGVTGCDNWCDEEYPQCDTR